METLKIKIAKFDNEKEYIISFSDNILVNDKNVFGSFQFKEVEGIITNSFRSKVEAQVKERKEKELMLKKEFINSLVSKLPIFNPTFLEKRIVEIIDGGDNKFAILVKKEMVDIYLFENKEFCYFANTEMYYAKEEYIPFSISEFETVVAKQDHLQTVIHFRKHN